MRALTVDEVGVVSGGIFQDGTAYRITALENRYTDAFPRKWPLVDFGRAGGHWVLEYHQPPAPGSGETSTFDLAMAIGGFMATLVPGAQPGLVISGPVLMEKLMKWLAGD